MASNTRYPPRGASWGGPGHSRPASDAGWGVCKWTAQMDLYITQIPAPTHRVAQSKRSAVRKGGVLGERGTASGRRRDGERERGRYQESRFSQISLHLRDKGNNGFRCGKLQRDTYHLPLHCERRITGSTEQRERDAVHARMWGDILKCAPDNLLQKHTWIKSYWTLTLSYCGGGWGSHQHFYLLNQFYLLCEINAEIFPRWHLCRNELTVRSFQEIWRPCSEANRPEAEEERGGASVGGIDRFAGHVFISRVHTSSACCLRCFYKITANLHPSKILDPGYLQVKNVSVPMSWKYILSVRVQWWDVWSGQSAEIRSPSCVNNWCWM